MSGVDGAKVDGVTVGPGCFSSIVNVILKLFYDEIKTH